MRFSPRVVNVSISFVSLALSLLAAEIGLRFTTPPCSEMLLERGFELHHRYFVSDPVLALRRRSNVDFFFRFEDRKSGFVHFVTNNQGLRRSGDTSFEKSGAVRRILALGDSQVDGVVDNEENLTALLEARLNSRDGKGGPRWQVLNAAVGSYSPCQNYLWYRETGKRYVPDLVLLTFYLGNDLAELATEDRPRLVEREGEFLEVRPRVGSVQSALLTKQSTLSRLERAATRNSYFYSHAKSFSRRLVSRIRSGAGSGQVTVDPIACVAQSLGQISWTNNHHDYRRNLVVFREILRRIRVEVEGGGGRLWLVILPTRLKVEPEMDRNRVSQSSRLLGLSSEDLEFEDRLARDVARVGEALDVPVLDLGPAFRAAHRREKQPLFYQLDWHINTFGHRVAAEAIYDKLQRLGLTGPSPETADANR